MTISIKNKGRDAIYNQEEINTKKGEIKKNREKKNLKQLLNQRHRTRHTTATCGNTEPPTPPLICYKDEDGSVTHTANLLGN